MTTSERHFFVQKFGENAEVSGVEDIWTVGGAYGGFVAAAATTTIVSDSEEDDADKEPAGTGAYTVTVQGLDSDYLLTSETATMNGAGAVTLTNEYLRVFRAFVATVGSNTTNVGNIQIKHGATVLAQIDAAAGQTLMAIYTIPADYKNAFLLSWYVSVSKTANAAYAGMDLQFRPSGGAWRVLSSQFLQTAGTSYVNHHYRSLPLLAAKTDIRLRATEVSATVLVAGGFDLAMTHTADPGVGTGILAERTL